MDNRNIRDYLQPGKRAHLVGIGGVSMASLAEVLHGAGVTVTGSDQKESATVLHLRKLGIQVVTPSRRAPWQTMAAMMPSRRASIPAGSLRLSGFSLRGGFGSARRERPRAGQASAFPAQSSHTKAAAAHMAEAAKNMLLQPDHRMHRGAARYTAMVPKELPQETRTLARR